jgi:hypothetical protein
MAFSSQVHNGIGLEVFEHRPYSFGIYDVDLGEPIAITVLQVSQRIQVPRIRQLVDVQNFVAGFNHQANKVRTYKASATGY